MWSDVKLLFGLVVGLALYPFGIHWVLVANAVLTALWLAMDALENYWLSGGRGATHSDRAGEGQ